MGIYYHDQLIFGPRGPAGPDGNPIGTVISFMGVSAPDDYLVCDGAVYNVSEYPELAAFFSEQFGVSNYFGGDGTATFAVPDMRNLFLRGYHGEAEEDLSGNVGERQEATISNDVTLMKSASYTSHPVNMAVLFCIKAKISKGSINSEETYSTEEVRIGTWIDGKPLYMIVIKTTISLTNGVKNNFISIPVDVSNVAQLYGALGPTTWGAQYSIPFVESGTNSIGLVYESGRFNVATQWNGVHNDVPIVLVFKYTKPTD